MSFNDTFGGAQGGRTGFRAKMAAAAGALLVTGSLVGGTAAGHGAGDVPAAPGHPAPVVATAAGSAGRTIGAGGDSYAPIVEETAPAVVTELGVQTALAGATTGPHRRTPSAG